MGNLKVVNQLNIAYNDIESEGLHVTSSTQQPYSVEQSFLTRVNGTANGNSPTVYLNVTPPSLDLTPTGILIEAIIMPAQLPNANTTILAGTAPIRFKQIAIIKPGYSTHSAFSHTPLNIPSPNNVTYTTSQPFEILGNNTDEYNYIDYDNSTKTFSCYLSIRGNSKMIKGTYLLV